MTMRRLMTWLFGAFLLLLREDAFALGLVFKLQPRQFDPYHCQQSGPHQRPDDCGNHQTIRNVPDNRQLRHMRGERYQHRQEGDQRHDGVDKTDAHILQR